MVTDPVRRTQIEVDVAVFAPAERGSSRRILSLGEAKWSKRMTLADIERLQRAAQLLADRGYDTSATKLTCYSGSGFDDHLREAAAHDPHIHLVALTDLYAPSP